MSQNGSKVRKLFRFPGQSKLEVCLVLALIVSHADLLIKGGGGGWCGHPDPEISPQFGLKIRGGGPPGAPSLDPPLEKLAQFC